MFYIHKQTLTFAKKKKQTTTKMKQKIKWKRNDMKISAEKRTGKKKTK